MYPKPAQTACDDLMRRELWASRVNFLGGSPPDGPTEVTAKIRYRAKDAPATMNAITCGGEDWAEITFHDPQRAVTPGQAVVFYQGEQVLGGGIIETQAPKPASTFSEA